MDGTSLVTTADFYEREQKWKEQAWVINNTACSIGLRLSPFTQIRGMISTMRVST